MVTTTEQQTSSNPQAFPVADMQATLAVRPRTIGGIVWGRFVLRVFWIAVQLAILFAMMVVRQRGIFFYQGF